MILSLSGVILDGTTPITASPEIQDISLPEGEHAQVNIAITGEDSTAFDLTGYDLHFVARRNSKKTPIVNVDGVILSAPGGTASFEITSDLTDSKRGFYKYDVWIVEAATDKGFRVVPLSEFLVTDASFDVDDL